MNLEELLQRQANGETLTKEELDFISMKQAESLLNQDLISQGLISPQANPNTNNSNTLSNEFGIGRVQPRPAGNSTMPTGINKDIQDIPPFYLDTDLPTTQRVEPRPAGNIPTNTPNLSLDRSNQDIPREYLKDYKLSDDQLSQVALYSNILGAGVSFDTALFSLGQSIGTDDKGTANTMRGVGAAGKLITGGARQLLSGVAYERRNDYVEDYNDKVKRDQMIGEYIETAKYPINPGGALFEKGGTKEGLYKDLGKYLNKRKYEDGEEVQGDNMQKSVAPTRQDNYAVGDTITFRDKSGKLITGKIASIKNGEIEII